MKREQLEQILLDVQKPAQYIGGELNSVMKDKSKVDCRLAFCFPDKYEVGMSHLGMKILYSLYNLRENWWCERVFAPDADMEQLMREKNIPLYGLESLDPIKDFDFVLFTLQYEMSYTAILNMLDRSVKLERRNSNDDTMEAINCDTIGRLSVPVFGSL